MFESLPEGQPGEPRTRPAPAIKGGFTRGLRLGTPIFLGYVPVGAAFGILATRLGFTIGETVTCSATALAGAGQFIALSLLKGGSSAFTTLFATTVVNLRYLLFSTTLSPHLKGVHPGSRAWLAFTLTDETFAINIADLREGHATPASMAGVGFIAWAGWVSGTLVGSLGAERIGDPSRWGVEFAMPAMFAALFVALADDLRAVAAGATAALVALLLPFAQRLGVPLDPAWYVVIASMTAATLATAVFRER